MIAGTASLRGRWVLLLAGFLCACVLAPGRAAATESEDFNNARTAYHRGDYPTAVQLFEAMVGGETPAIRDPVLVQESREYLAAAYVLVGQPDLAAAQFLDLLRAEPDPERYRLDPTAFPQAVIDVFAEVHRRIVRSRREAETSRRREAEREEARRREAVLRLIDRAAQDEVVIEHSRALAWVPFGAGQFQNGDEALGAFFLASQSVTFLGALVTMSVWFPLSDVLAPNGAPVFRDALQGLQIANWVSAGAFGLLAAIGILEAHINFVPSHRARSEREVPADLLEGLDLSIGPGGVGLRLRF